MEREQLREIQAGLHPASGGDGSLLCYCVVVQSLSSPPQLSVALKAE